MDGEPWLQQPCVITCTHFNRELMLANSDAAAAAAATAVGEMRASNAGMISHILLCHEQLK